MAKKSFKCSSTQFFLQHHDDTYARDRKGRLWDKIIMHILYGNSYYLQH